jgi:hypothetical protein
MGMTTDTVGVEMGVEEEVKVVKTRTREREVLTVEGASATFGFNREPFE